MVYSDKENIMMTIKNFIKQHPLLTYFALVFALSWGSWLVLTGGAPMRSDPRFMFIVLTAPVAPAVAGLLMTGLTAGRAGYRELLARLTRWRVPARWYGVALLPAPLVAIMTAILLALSLRSPEFLPAVFTTADPVGLLLPGIIGGLLVGLCEELGWTGFAIPRLRPQYGILATGLLMGVVWGAWHYPLFSRSDSFTGALPLALLLFQLFSWLPAYRVLMVWVYDHTGSLLVVVLMHISLAATSIIFPPSVMSDMQSLISILVSATTWWLLVVAVAAADRGQTERVAVGQPR
jgi:membrane protease YdiL (CAAX protease family)